MLEGVVRLGTILHCYSEHLCHKGVLRPQGERFVIVVYGILYAVLHSSMVLGRAQPATRQWLGHAWSSICVGDRQCLCM